MYKKLCIMVDKDARCLLKKAGMSSNTHGKVTLKLMGIHKVTDHVKYSDTKYLQKHFVHMYNFIFIYYFWVPVNSISYT